VCSSDLYDITGPAKINDHASGYTLHVMSKESFKSLSQRHHEGYNTTVSKIVQSLFGKIKDKKVLKVSATKFVDRFVMTGDKTIPCIKMLTRYAVSSKGNGGYLFFENNKEFMFTPIKELYDQEPIKNFTYSSQPAYENPDNIHEENFETFQDFQYDEPNKFIDEIIKGMHGKTTKHLGLMEKQVAEFKFDKTKFFNKGLSLGKHPFKLETDIQYSNNVSIAYTIEPRQSEPHLGKNELTVLHAMSTCVNVGVFGDSTVKAGTICEASIPTYGTKDFTPENIDMLTGKFLIAEVKHIITPKIYNQRLLLIKDGFMEMVG
jgi:hypothetical protein